MIKIIVAADRTTYGIGFDGKMAWDASLYPNMSYDLRYFKEQTVGAGNNAVLMGKNTMNSLLDINMYPLRNRLNYFISRSEQKPFNSLENAVNLITRNVEDLWIIGGSQIYHQAIEQRLVDQVIISWVDLPFLSYDTYFPSVSFLQEHGYLETVCNKQEYGGKIILSIFSRI